MLSGLANGLVLRSASLAHRGTWTGGLQGIPGAELKELFQIRQASTE